MAKYETQLSIKCPRCKITNFSRHMKDWDFFNDNCFGCNLSLSVKRVDENPKNWEWNEWYLKNVYRKYGVG